MFVIKCAFRWIDKYSYFCAFLNSSFSVDERQAVSLLFQKDTHAHSQTHTSIPLGEEQSKGRAGESHGAEHRVGKPSTEVLIQMLTNMYSNPGRHRDAQIEMDDFHSNVIWLIRSVTSPPRSNGAEVRGHVHVPWVQKLTIFFLLSIPLLPTYSYTAC